MLIFQPYSGGKVWFNYNESPEFSSTEFPTETKLLCKIQQERKMSSKYDLYPVVSTVNWWQHNLKLRKKVKYSSPIAFWLGY